MRAAFAIAAVLTFIALPASAADADAMAKAADGFYAAYQVFHPSDGIPDAKGRAKYAPYISARLNKQLIDAGAAEDAFARDNKDTPPLIEGDLFTANFEGATTVKVGACTGDAKSGHCAIQLTYADANPKSKPFNWTDTAYLVNEGGGWRVDDIAYGGNWDFGNKGRMSETLKMAIDNASN